MVYHSESQEEVHLGLGKQGYPRGLSSNCWWYLFCTFTLVRPTVSGSLCLKVQTLGESIWLVWLDSRILFWTNQFKSRGNGNRSTLAWRRSLWVRYMVSSKAALTSFYGVICDYCVGITHMLCFCIFDGGRPLKQGLLGSMHVPALFLYG